MANKKTNKFAAIDSAAKEVKEKSAQAAPAETVKEQPVVKNEPEKTVKTEEKAPAVQTKVNENAPSPAEAKPEAKNPVKAAAKKAESKAPEAAGVSEKLVVEFTGANYESGEIVRKCKAAFAADHAGEKLAGIEVYINVSERRAYYVANGKAEGKYIEL